MDLSLLRTNETLADFVATFERAELPRPHWTHGAHVAMGTLYLLRHGPVVLPHMRTAIRRHNASVGTPPNAYHETLTILWLAIVDDFLRHTPHTTELEAVRATVAEFGEQRKLHETFYSFNIIASDEARTSWVAPDLRPLEIRFLLTPY